MADAGQIITACARSFGIPREVLLSRARTRSIARARQAAYWILREFPKASGAQRSYPQIGELLGRDHGTVIYGKELADYLLEHDASFLAQIADAGEMLSRAEPLAPIRPEDLPRSAPKVVLRAADFQHVKPRNEPASDDHDARMRLHGTFALGRALQAAMSAGEQGAQ